MTVVLDDTDSETMTTVDETPPVQASWSARAGAFTVDVIFPVSVIAVALVAKPVVYWFSSLPAARIDWFFWVCLGVAVVGLVAVGVNRLLLPAITGWSLGRSLFGIAVVDRDGSPVSPWRLALREMAHVLDTLALFIGWLWPLWDSRSRTFADLLTGTEVHQVPGEHPDRRRRVGAALAAAALIAVLLAGLGYQTIYRQQVATNQAREYLAKEGPKIVVDMLSYEVATLQPDFSRAQGLATDSYRPQLLAQQQAVQKAGPVDNDYWATNSSVLSVSRDQAVMLILLQGQRGAAPKQRLITATVRVNFQKSAAGQWQVSNLTVLARPNTNKQGQ